MLASIAALQQMENPNFKLHDFLDREKYFKNHPDKLKSYMKRKNNK